MSIYALLLPCRWGSETVIVRISVVPKDVPCLFSFPLLKALGCILDLCEFKIKFSKLSEAQEMLHKLPTGHVAVDLGMSNAMEPTDLGFSTCREGSEVGACTESVKQRLGQVEFSAHCIHICSLPESAFETVIASDDSSDDNEDGYHALVVVDGSDSDDVHHFRNHSQMRGAPLFRETLPGWRARAKLFGLARAPRIAQPRSGSDADTETDGKSIGAVGPKGVHAMEAGHSSEDAGRHEGRKRKARTDGGSHSDLDLADEEGAAGGSCDRGARDRSSGSEQDDSDCASGKDPSCSRGRTDERLPSVEGAKGTRQNAGGRPRPRDRRTRPPPTQAREGLDSTLDDCGNTGGRRVAEQYRMGGTGGESGLDGHGGSESDSQGEELPVRSGIKCSRRRIGASKVPRPSERR